MSWTSKRHIAEKFAEGFDGRFDERLGHVYKTIVRPQDVLAVIGGTTEKIQQSDGTVIEFPISEFEFVVDARALPITLVETAKMRQARLKREEDRIARHWKRLLGREKEIQPIEIQRNP
jgi:hypothetical protein